MVRLKVNTVTLVSISSKFQFHYGTIKRRHQLWVAGRWTVFQFHYGTIKRERGFAQLGYATRFQFHYGTIKSLTLEKISALIFKNLADTKL